MYCRIIEKAEINRFLMLGAGNLRITTAVMQYGYRIIDDLLQGLRIYIAQQGYQKVADPVGLGMENVVDAAEPERDTIVYPKFNRSRCVGCGRCFLSCRDGWHQTLRFDKKTRKPIFIPKNCVGCHTGGHQRGWQEDRHSEKLTGALRPAVWNTEEPWRNHNEEQPSQLPKGKSWAWKRYAHRRDSDTRSFDGRNSDREI